MITESQKESIVRAMEHYIESKDLSANDFSRNVKMSTSYISALVNRNWNEMQAGKKKVVIKDMYFEKIADMVNYELAVSDWGHFDTINHQLISDTLNEVRKYKTVAAIDGPTGIGKTYSVQDYRRRFPKNTYVIECAGDFTAKRFIVELSRVMGETPFGVTTDLRLNIARRLTRDIDPLLIIDEAENLKDNAWHSVKKLMDDVASSTNRQCGIVLCGANEFQQNMERKAAKMKEPFPQVNSRIKEGGYCSLLSMNFRDKSDVLSQLGIHNPDVKKRIHTTCNNMREVYGAVTKLRREERITKSPIEELALKIL